MTEKHIKPHHGNIISKYQTVWNSIGQMTQFLQQIYFKGKRKRDGEVAYKLRFRETPTNAISKPWFKQTKKDYSIYDTTGNANWLECDIKELLWTFLYIKWYCGYFKCLW